MFPTADKQSDYISTHNWLFIFSFPSRRGTFSSVLRVFFLLIFPFSRFIQRIKMKIILLSPQPIPSNGGQKECVLSSPLLAQATAPKKTGFSGIQRQPLRTPRQAKAIHVRSGVYEATLTNDKHDAFTKKNSGFLFFTPFSLSTSLYTTGMIQVWFSASPLSDNLVLLHKVQYKLLVPRYII